MAHQVKWTQRASLDLAGIKAYIEADRSAGAGREIGDILRKVDLLEAFPEIGPIFRRVDDVEHRAVLAGKYRIIYFIRREEPCIDIVAIRHGAQDEPASL